MVRMTRDTCPIGTIRYTRGVCRVDVDMYQIERADNRGSTMPKSLIRLSNQPGKGTRVISYHSTNEIEQASKMCSSIRLGPLAPETIFGPCVALGR